MQWDFARDCPLILGGLLDAVAAGMRALPEVQPERLSRMADAERWGEAVARGLGWAPGTFSNTLGANRAAVNESSLEESPVAVIDLAIRSPIFRGTMKDLLQTLPKLSPPAAVRSSDWPKSPRALSVRLRQLATLLRSIGIDVEFLRDGQLRIVTVAMAERRDESATGNRSLIIDERFGA